MDRIVGAFFFYNALADMQPPERKAAFGRLREHGVNLVLTESDTYDGDVIAAAHAAGLSFWAGVGCFLDTDPAGARPQPILATGEPKPQLEWYRGRIPTDREHAVARLDLIERIVTHHEVDGLLLDFIRWPLHWELELRPGWPAPVENSFDATTLEDFADRTGLDVPTDTPAQAATWILTNAPEAWMSYKAGIVTEFVSTIRARVDDTAARALPLAMTVVPVRPDWVGQRYRDLAEHVDVFMPMLYHSILQRPPDWVAEELRATRSQTDATVAPILQIDSDGSAQGADWGAPVSNEDLAVALRGGFEAGGDGVAFFTGSTLLQGARLGVVAGLLDELG